MYAWEPDPRNVAVIKGKQFGIELCEAAVGDRDGFATLYLSTADRDKWTQSNSIRKPYAHLAVHPEIRFRETVTVPVVRLDSFFNARGWPSAIDLIWCDVQGSEGDVVIGGAKTLARTQFFYTEFDNRELYEGQPSLGQLAALVGKNFVIERIFDNNVLFRNIAMNGVSGSTTRSIISGAGSPRSSRELDRPRFRARLRSTPT